MQPVDIEKYSRQVLFAPIGEEGQRRLLASSAVLVGCGALGSASANLLVRAGVGRLRIVDRDFVEPSNLQRQLLFDEADARDSLPKAIAAERKLLAINSAIRVEGVVADLTPRNAANLLSGFDLLLDGTDNFETRHLLNDFSVSHGVPWIYAAVVASYGLTLAVVPTMTACLACLLESRTVQDLEPTCDTVGVLNQAVGVIASLQSAEALKILSGRADALHGRLLTFDVWTGRSQSVAVVRNPQCPVCAQRIFAHLEGSAQPHVTMCGRDSVQIHEHARQLDLAGLGRRLAPAVSAVQHNDFLVRFAVPPYEVTVFADGRAIVKGTRDAAVARSLYARFIGT